MGETPTISTHVLDTEHGRPAEGVSVALYRVAADQETRVGAATTDEDGRIRRLLSTELSAGIYRLEFELDARFFRRVSVTFIVEDTARSYHVPLLLAPYSLATYRGS